MQQRFPPKPKAQQPESGDFSEEIAGKQVAVKLADGVQLDGTVVEARKYWIKLRASSKTLLLNKAHIVWLELTP